MCHCDFALCSGLGQARCSRYDSVRFPVNRIYSIIDIAKRDAYVCGIAEAYCMNVAAGIASYDGVTETRTPDQCCHRCLDLKSTKLLTTSVTPEDDDKTVICPTCKQ